MIERRRFIIGETCMDVTADSQYMHVPEKAIAEARREIEYKISCDPFFGVTYFPYPPCEGDSHIVRRMCEASVAAEVGPMAAVAGAVAAHVIESLMDEGCTYAVADNGGDIALIADREVAVSLYVGDSEFDGIFMSVGPTDGIMSICSSSGTIGPSVSFGDSGICTVIARDPVLADACATLLGNGVKHSADIAEQVQVMR